MKPYFEDKESGIVLYHGDALEVLERLDGESVDLLLTDPPYGQNWLSGTRAKFDPLRKRIAGDKNLHTLRQAIPSIDRVMKTNSHLYFFASARPRLLAHSIEIVTAQLGEPKNVLVWHKGETGTGGDLQAGYSVNWEAIIYVNKGRHRLNGIRPLSVIHHPWNGKYDPVHPAVKPVSLIEKLIKTSSAPNDLVLDCFAGSGTTLRAAKNLGRRVIGIEIDKEYCERSVARLRGSVEETEYEIAA